MEIWSINEKHTLTCHLDADSTDDANKKMVDLSVKCPNRIFIITPTLTARRVVNGRVVCEDVYN